MSVILMSSLIAMLLQYMAAKLGIVSQMDLAQAIRARTSKSLGIVLWILTELAIMATDIAEVIGATIALYLLFNIPLVIAVFITVLDVFILLMLTKIGFRKIEAIVVCLIFVILFVFVYQVALSNPDWKNLFAGFVPNGKTFADSPVIGGETPLTGALGIIGATVMPHNLYLHSAVSQTREIDREDSSDIARAVRFSTWDSNIQLSMAFLVNALLLIMGVAVFKNGSVQDPSFFGLYEALSDPSAMSNGVLITVAKSGILSTLFTSCSSCFWTKLNDHRYLDWASNHGRLHPHAYANLVATSSHTFVIGHSGLDLCAVYKYERPNRRTHCFK